MRALATQGDGARSAEEYQQVFLGRIDALARDPRPAVREPLAGAELRSLADALRPFAGERAEAIEVDGAPVELNARQALSLRLVLHELATNAAK